jgi:hypothetical protein
MPSYVLIKRSSTRSESSFMTSLRLRTKARVESVSLFSASSRIKRMCVLRVAIPLDIAIPNSLEARQVDSFVLSLQKLTPP